MTDNFLQKSLDFVQKKDEYWKESNFANSKDCSLYLDVRQTHYFYFYKNKT